VRHPSARQRLPGGWVPVALCTAHPSLLIGRLFVRAVTQLMSEFNPFCHSEKPHSWNSPPIAPHSPMGL